MFFSVFVVVSSTLLFAFLLELSIDSIVFTLLLHGSTVNIRCEVTIFFFPSFFLCCFFHLAYSQNARINALYECTLCIHAEQTMCSQQKVRRGWGFNMFLNGKSLFHTHTCKIARMKRANEKEGERGGGGVGKRGIYFI